MGQGERPQVVNQLAVVVGPGLVVEGVGVGALAVGGADEGDDDGAVKVHEAGDDAGEAVEDV